MTKYIFLDIDGTLYSSATNETPESALRAIHKARQNGHKVFLCTGRSLAEIVTYLEYDIDGYILAAGAESLCRTANVSMIVQFQKKNYNT